MRFWLVAAIMASLAGSLRAETTLSGTWRGEYSCMGMSRASMVLDVEEDARGMLGGVFTFEAAEGSGSYNVAGRLAPDGSFTFVPRDWIERPSGFTALGLSGRLAPNGRRIEGTPVSCGMGRFAATRAASAAETAARTAPPAPLSGGPLAGLWSGGIECRMNRRSPPQVYPVSLWLFAEGEQIGGLAHVQTHATPGVAEGPVSDQFVVLSGRAENGGMALDRALVAEAGAARADLRAISTMPRPDGAQAGTVQMQRCEALTLMRRGAISGAPVSPALSGVWTAPAEGETVVALHVLAEGSAPVAELRAAYPASKPEAERDRLRIVLAPVSAPGNHLIWAPVARRDATGIFAGRHRLAEARAFVTTVAPDGSLRLLGALRPAEVTAALAGDGTSVPQGAEDRSYLLTRPGEDMIAALAQGEAPPVSFGGGLGGTITQAASREAQCRQLDAWLQPYAGNVDISRMSIDAALRELAPAFADPVFEPVFGLPFLLTTQTERQALARFIRETCDRGMGLKLVGFVGGFLFQTENQFSKFNAMLANTSETGGWLDAARAETEALGPAQASLDRIAELRRELRTRQRDLTPAQQSAAEAQFDRREAELQAGIFLKEAEALPSEGLQQGALNRVFGLMDRMERSGLDAGLLAPVRVVAEQKSAAILSAPIEAAAALAPTLPQSLDGLRQGQEALAPLVAHSKAMDRHFGTLDREGRLRPLYRRLDELYADPRIQAGFRAELQQVDPAGGDPEAAVRNVAGRYVPLDESRTPPEFARIIADAVDAAEVRSVRVVDLSTPVSDLEPSAEDIAAFAVNRARRVNDNMQATENACLWGTPTDPIQALMCLGQPALWTGQTGSGVRLLEVRKLGCSEETPGISYRCRFTQTIDMDLAGMEAFGAATLEGMTQNLSSGEALDAQFLKAKDGGWTVITGDLD